VRIITAEQPLWVIDLLDSLGYSSVHVNDRFTGNSAGATTTIELDGIPMQALGGYGISSAPLPGFSHPPLLWANLPITQDVPLRYLIAMMENMGCAPEGTLSVLYAKAELIRTKAKRRDRHSLNQKANSLMAPTFIFQSPQFLKYFLDHFPTFMHNCLPPFVMGHSGDSLPSGPTQARYNGGPVPLATFLLNLQGKEFRHYNSNHSDNAHKALSPPPESATTPKLDYHASISRLLAAAKRDLLPNDFAQLLQQFRQPADLPEVPVGMQSITVTGRNVSPAKRNWTDEIDHNPLHAKRRSG
jgi:hypothetical protein